MFTRGHRKTEATPKEAPAPEDEPEEDATVMFTVDELRARAQAEEEEEETPEDDATVIFKRPRPKDGES